MKRVINFVKVASLTVLFSLSACDKTLEEFNVNPNEATKVPTPALLTSFQKESMDFIWDQWHNGRFGMLYAQYWAQNTYTDESRYLLRQAVNNNYWTYYYAGRDVVRDGTTNGGGIKDLQEIIRLNTEFPKDYVVYGETANQIAVARIMKAWMFQIITDIWGDVPYFEAFQGAKNPSPAYTKQSEIYADLLKELKEASEQIDVNKKAYGDGDIIYKGDMAKWKKFANSLRLRVALRMADRDPVAAKAAIIDAVASGTFTNNADNALLPYQEAVPNNNPLNEAYKTRADFAVSEPLVKLMKSLSDPRLGIYADKPVKGDDYVGKPYGQSQSAAAAVPNDVISQPGEKVLEPTAPGVYMDFAEVAFAKAEAVERGFITGSAMDFYNQGITASMNFWGVTDDAAIKAYYTDKAPYDAANWKQSIGVQKWLALYMQGIQGWTEWRRLDFTGVLVMPVAGPLAGTGIPLRVTYPTNEQSLNNANYSAAVSNQGPDELGTRLWWDVK